jgi:hypothetical protein
MLGGGVAMSFAWRVLIIENNFAISSFVAQTASACSYSPASMFWSLLTSVCEELSALRVWEGGNGCY